MSALRALVSGAGGFLGPAVCERLRAQGWHVLALLRKRRAGPWDETVEHTLAEGKDLRLAGPIDAVLHLAGRAHALTETPGEEEAYFRTNVGGTEELLKASQRAGVRRFVLFSSVKAHGEETGTAAVDEMDLPRPTTPYGRSKRESERLVCESGLVREPVVLRLSMVYGGASKGNLARMVAAVAGNRFPPLPDTKNARSMVHRDDVSEAAWLAISTAAAAGKTYFVTDGRAYSTRQIFEWICQALGRPAPQWTVPVWVLRALARGGDLIGLVRGRRFAIDSDALQKLLASAHYSNARFVEDVGFTPRHDLRSALPDIVREVQRGRP